jgi:hypothetical protein
MGRIVVAAYLTLIGCTGWIFFLAYVLLTAKGLDPPAYLFFLAVVIPAASSLFLVLKLKLYRSSEANNISEQNRILKLKIEQAELKAKLDSRQPRG